ncbi:MAG: hypothetical protein AAFX32_15275 [Pseudomonadota bacterium]
MSLFPHRTAGCRVETRYGKTVMQLNCLDAALRQAELGPSQYWRRHPSSRETGKPYWHGTETFEQAIELGRYGWKEGRENLLRAKISLKDLAEGHISLRSEDRDVYGCRPDVPLYCAGAPEHMVVPGDRFGPSAPLVDLVVQLNVTGQTDSDEMTNYGSALATLIDATEAEQRRVRVTLAYGMAAREFKLDVLVRVKDHNEALDIDRLAFCLANPAMFRRVIFSFIEQGCSKEWFHAWGPGYGHPVTFECAQSEIFVPSLEHWRGKRDWSTPEAAFETMKTALVKELEGGDDE